MENESKFFKIYFILVIIYSIIGLSNSIFSGMIETYGQMPNLLMILASIFSFLIFILSIVALVIFIKNKFAKITLVIPIYELVTAILMGIWGVVIGVLSVVQANPIDNQSIPLVMIIVGFLTSLFELVFSAYVLKKYGFNQ
jgi:hypothetical protein